jgi:octaprenyl-diphosphate synthase
MHLPEPTQTAPQRLPPRLEAIFSEVLDDLVSVEQFIRDEIVSNVDLIQKTSRYVHESGGKRIRPSLLLLSARLCGYSGSRARDYAAVMEFIHTATLVHDDIVDDAALRRGRSSVNSLLGNHVTVLLGDYLYIRSLAMAIDMGDISILKVICDVTARMIEGELLELTRSGDLNLTEDEYLDILKRKTAFLFSGCARIGAMLGNPAWEEPLGDYGLHLGMAFQVVDDLLDFTADEERLGKPVLSDMKEGHLTLPVLYLLRAEPRASGLVKAVVEARAIDDQRREEILGMLRRHRVLDATRRVARAYAEKAKHALFALPDSVQRESLLALTDYVVERER